jgi:hypothetical protein
MTSWRFFASTPLAVDSNDFDAEHADNCAETCGLLLVTNIIPAVFRNIRVLRVKTSLIGGSQLNRNLATAIEPLSTTIPMLVRITGHEPMITP